MMNSDDCRKRASGCLKAAELSSDPNREQSWRKLSDLWLIGPMCLADYPEQIAAPFITGLRDSCGLNYMSRLSTSSISTLAVQSRTTRCRAIGA